MQAAYLAFALLFLLLTGCSQPTAYSIKADQVIALDHPIHIPDIPSVFDISKNAALQEYLIEVAANNKDLQSLATTIHAFELEQRIVGAEASPQARGELSQQRNEDLRADDFEFIQQDDVSADINISWALDVWGRLADQTQAATLQTQQVNFIYEHALRVLTAQAAQTWLALWRIQNLIQYTEQRSKNAHNLLNTIEEYYLNGTADYESVLEQRANTIQIREQLAQLNTEQQIHQHRLNILRGQPPKTFIALHNNNIQAVITELPTEIPAIYLQNRPDILSAFKQIEILDAQTRAAYKALLPEFSLTGTLSRNTETITDVFSGDYLWQLVGGFTQVLFDKGQLYNQAKQNNKQAESSLYRYEHVVLEAMEEVENSLANDKGLHARLTLTHKRLHETKRLLTSNQEAYTDGAVTVIPLLLSREQILQMQHAWVEVQTEYLNNRISLALATGQPLDYKVE